jgi:hypothetical protein
MRRSRIAPQTAERVLALARQVDPETLAEFILCNYFYGAGRVEEAVQRLAWEREYERCEAEVEALQADNRARHERDKGRLDSPEAILRALRLDERSSQRMDVLWKRMDELHGLLYARQERTA